MKYIVMTFNKIKKYLIEQHKHHNIVDPLTTIIKLCINAHLPLNSKLYIKNNILYFQEPSLIQSTFRSFNGYEKNDLHNLYLPISYACNFYLLEKFKLHNNEELKDKYIYIFNLAKSGLINLKKTYKEHQIISHCIAHYINVIDLTIKDSEELSNFNSMNDSYFRDNSQINHIYTTLLSYWNDQIVIVIHNIFKLLEDCPEENKIHYINALYELLKIIDIKASTYIQSYN